MHHLTPIAVSVCVCVCQYDAIRKWTFLHRVCENNINHSNNNTPFPPRNLLYENKFWNIQKRPEKQMTAHYTLKLFIKLSHEMCITHPSFRNEKHGTIEIRVLLLYIMHKYCVCDWPSINLQLFWWKFVKLFSSVSYSVKRITRKRWLYGTSAGIR